MKNCIDKFDGKYAFLSNYYESKMLYEGIEYTSSEAVFQAQKTLDIELRKEIAVMPPNKAKRAGRKLEIRPDWDLIRNKVMFDIVYVKFTQNEELKQRLLSTKDAELIEGNYWKDTHWGVCNGVGLNMLGKTLMVVREMLKNN